MSSGGFEGVHVEALSTEIGFTQGFSNINPWAGEHPASTAATLGCNLADFFGLSRFRVGKVACTFWLSIIFVLGYLEEVEAISRQFAQRNCRRKG